MDATKLHGFLTVDKPSGWTSRDVVNRVTYLLRRVTGCRIKTGHCGTLDPMATGVLVVAVGYATRLVTRVQTQKKGYLGRFVLGQTTNTDDVTGKVTASCSLDEFAISEASIKELLPGFTGSIQQTPPAFSAIKINGKRAYKLARKGEEVEVPPRPVQIDRLQLTDFSLPEFELEIKCGAGTYIRSVGRDIGKRLKCGATMKSLVRTYVGIFKLQDSIALDDLSEESVLGQMVASQNAVPNLPRVTVSAEELKQVRNGRPIATGDRISVLQKAASIHQSTEDNSDSQSGALLQDRSGLPVEDESPDLLQNKMVNLTSEVVLENEEGDFVALAKMDEHIIRCLVVFPDLRGRK